MRQFMITGGAGFIGSNFIHYMLNRYEDVSIINIDKLTYAGNLENLKTVENDPRYRFVKGDICDQALIERLMPEVDVVVNFAAESHVDRVDWRARRFHQNRCLRRVRCCSKPRVIIG